jgi:hypothetical protein
MGISPPAAVLVWENLYKSETQRTRDTEDLETAGTSIAANKLGEYPCFLRVGVLRGNLVRNDSRNVDVAVRPISTARSLGLG